MEIIIFAALAFASYKIWKLCNLRNKSPQMTNDIVLSKGILYQSLNKHMEGLGVEPDKPLAIRMSRFLRFGTTVARQAAGISTPTEKMDAGPESAAIVMFVQQGIHTLLTLEHGSNSVNTTKYKTEFAKVFELSMFIVFMYSSLSKLDDRGKEILTNGTDITRNAQKNNPELLQFIFHSWDFFLQGPPEAAVVKMGNAMHQAVNWCENTLSASCKTESHIK